VTTFPFYALLMALVLETTLLITVKIAYSSALWMARGMNAITATNHLMAELTALAVRQRFVPPAMDPDTNGVPH
jgi:hypothetical protein